ncbi:MAG: phosphoribosylformylglycinamidine synthase [Deltaproteobacteria bacterium]|jgi:phosphoribosylformylglycinamidine synthase subunit PurSL|nr:phosphoribosylformylglycinamidine synthase [Deltaproteobacteria bacterium]MBT4265905.1 phosphoribosylformylglycinamidine synthase [Deltaproteobacteria bacterium]MBT4643673.1 phosphoribosylformylglycinamidine synthase [Deltaproteobacteria bacterium]MBT6499983.1 phosphoribosylformylglycinamidine synthase [Deltaproteobacteria bacterium]MBT6611149.1 phosphoribosylformylglycinamidine synthase [Deltaproteobacteria bacterium]
MLHRLEVKLKQQLEDPEGIKAIQLFKKAEWPQIHNIRTLQVYMIQCDQITSTEQMDALAKDLFVDPVLHEYVVDGFTGDQQSFDWYVEIGFRAGVTDNAGKVARENLELRLPEKFSGKEIVASSIGYYIQGDFNEAEINSAVDHLLMNKLIQRKTVVASSNWTADKETLKQVPMPRGDEKISVETLDCSSIDKILALSDERILALSAEEATIIHNWFKQDAVRDQRKKSGLPEQPTDIELETLAQTWSEHCKHKIFSSNIQYTDELGNREEIHSLYKSYIQRATHEIKQKLGEDDWCLSVFKDNAGIIKFNDDYSVAFKVETHNSPSALDPYGGALTGIVGVNRDSFGVGMGAELIANIDVFCFGPQDYSKQLPSRLLHPSRIYEGVRLGVEHGGNQSGIPTVNGAIVFDECYVGKPLVFCGTASVMPALHDGKPSEDKTARPGDIIVMNGGRIGKDGIHGATFSSVALDENSPVSAVQIGDAITQKRMFDFLWEAKKENLYTCITDNGAGGLSSSVGEMAESSGGCRLHLDRAPLKYEGLQPWEILISEAQERMTVSVAPDKIERFLELSEEMQVESTVLGEFTDSGFFECFYHDELVASLEMAFMHNGLPAMNLTAEWTPPLQEIIQHPEPQDYAKILHTLLSRPNVCSKESVIRQYDHEVQGGSVIKPLVGVENDGPADAGVIRPVLNSMEGIAIANGICPKYSNLDTYQMVACAIDEAIRNIIAIGGSLEQMAGLDNFCWPDPVQSAHTPDGTYKLAQLVRACKALYDYCLGFGVPCISGKDSMKNDANLDGQKISILPTLLFSTIGKIADVRKCLTSDLKAAGDLVYLVGETFDECGGSEYYQELNIKGGLGPRVDLKTAKNRYEKISTATKQGLICSNHDCSDAGFAAAAVEKAIGGKLGLDLDLAPANINHSLKKDRFLFSESQSRFVLTIHPDNQQNFENLMQDTACYLIGIVTLDPTIKIAFGDETVICESVSDLETSWKKTLSHAV